MLVNLKGQRVKVGGALNARIRISAKRTLQKTELESGLFFSTKVKNLKPSKQTWRETISSFVFRLLHFHKTTNLDVKDKPVVVRTNTSKLGHQTLRGKDHNAINPLHPNISMHILHTIFYQYLDNCPPTPPLP